ncbi:MAG: lasso peptide biosynthesis B2 protein [Rhodobacteraceae bacterium]|nr:lasso peptide biosynthesis B2 protein [Paracoccaceae bacterium]
MPISAQLLYDLVRAGFLLARARLELWRKDPVELLQRQMTLAGQEAAGGVDHMIERVAYAIPRMAARVPWRADCFVQAMAAQRWLAAHKIGSEIGIGVRKDQPAGFEAHAWLHCRGKVVTGGDIAGFVPFGGA